MKRLSIFMTIIMWTLGAVAQERIINGTVMDGEFKGEPLVGATVSVSNNEDNKGTVTDANGKFTLSVP